MELTEVDEISDNGQNTFIGKYRANGGGCTCQWFTGDLDELGIWNRTLSYEELWFLYQLSKPIDCTDFNACNFSEEANVDDESCLPSGCMDTKLATLVLRPCVMMVAATTVVVQAQAVMSEQSGVGNQIPVS